MHRMGVKVMMARAWLVGLWPLLVFSREIIIITWSSLGKDFSVTRSDEFKKKRGRQQLIQYYYYISMHILKFQCIVFADSFAPPILPAEFERGILLFSF